MGEKAAVIHVRLAAVDHVVKQFVDEFGDGEVEPELPRGLERVPQILDLKLGRASRFEGAVDHPLTVLGENATGREAALQCLPYLGTVGPAATREDERLTHGADGDGNDDLIG